MASLLRSAATCCCRALAGPSRLLSPSLPLALVDARRSIRFNDWGADFRSRSVEGRTSYLARKYPRKGTALGGVTDPSTALYRVRLTKRPEKLGRRIRKTAESLGFGKDGADRLKVVWVPQTAVWAGRILALKSLVTVQLVTEADRRKEVAYREMRNEIIKGYEVIGRAEDMIV
jgi:hypothetical protein